MNGILITGATGFIGSHLCMALNQECTALSRADGSFLDQDFCSRILQGVETVVHLAWSTVPGSPIESQLDGINEDIAGSVALFEACIAAGVRRLVFVSSGGTVYGVPEFTPLSESHPLRPISFYGISKVAVEHYLQAFSRNHGLEFAILRCSNAYGPGQTGKSGQGVIASWLSNIRSGKPLQVYGDGSIVRDFVYIDDVVKAILAAISAKSSSLTVNIGAGKGYSLKEILEIIIRITGCAPQITNLPGRRVDVPENILDCSLAKAELNWEPRIGTHEGIERTWSWWEI